MIEGIDLISHDCFYASIHDEAVDLALFRKLEGFAKHIERFPEV